MRVKTMSQAILLLGLIVAPCLAIAAEPTFKEGWFTTNDGVKLHYLEAGSGNPLVMVPILREPKVMRDVHRFTCIIASYVWRRAGGLNSVAGLPMQNAVCASSLTFAQRELTENTYIRQAQASCFCRWPRISSLGLTSCERL
jgi:hypothetical protein